MKAKKIKMFECHCEKPELSVSQPAEMEIPICYKCKKEMRMTGETAI